AAHIVAEQPVAAAITRIAGLAVPAEQPLETGRQAPDGLTLGLWALTRPARFTTLLGMLAATSSPPVVAAAVGLVGLRDGLDAIPAAWYRQLDLTDACLARPAPAADPPAAYVRSHRRLSWRPRRAHPTQSTPRLPPPAAVAS
ncbi:MAG TPA: hypothetical protein VE623_18940, partial [Acidimicrobiales bacterium]|nr:hypothetical protein [Acidimicrobiales bacterium]